MNALLLYSLIIHIVREGMRLVKPRVRFFLHSFAISAHTTSMKTMTTIRKNFFICGLAGWCMEILFTACNSFRRREMKLMGNTSLWMFPIYGMAALIGPLYSLIRRLPALLRSVIYSTGIFLFEFLCGSFLKRQGACPWDYSKAKSNINGVIRLDYAPFWMAAGLIFERLIARRKA